MSKYIILIIRNPYNFTIEQKVRYMYAQKLVRIIYPFF